MTTPPMPRLPARLAALVVGAALAATGLVTAAGAATAATYDSVS